FFFLFYALSRHLHSFPTRRSSDLERIILLEQQGVVRCVCQPKLCMVESGNLSHYQYRRFHRNGDKMCAIHPYDAHGAQFVSKKRSEEHTSELQSRENLVCRLLLEK